MKLSKPLVVGAVLTAGALVAAGVSTATAAAAPTPPAPANVHAVAAQQAATLVAGRPAFLNASAGESFVPGTVQSSHGLQYVPYERTHAGLPVVGGDFVVVTDSAGTVLSNSSALARPIGSLSTTPTLSQGQAEAVATRQLRSVSAVEGTRLVVYALGATPRLAWQSTVNGTGAEGYSRLTVTVDALTGAVLDRLEHVLRGTGTGHWNGPNPLSLRTRTGGSGFLLSDSSTNNMPCQNASGNTTFTGTDDVWGNGSGTDRETGCVDALFGAEREADMLSQWLGRNRMDGNGGAWPIRIGLNDQNAFYDGTQVQVGHNTANEWIGEIDVIAHEMGHGIDDHTPGSISRAGTQEFVADTFGAATESFVNEPSPFDTRDFLVGDKVNLVGSGPIRNMANPSALGDKNCYDSTIPNTEVHAAAGPGNHWFYLLAEGTNPTDGQPTSPTCNNTTITGVGVQNAITIMYNAMLRKTTSSSYLRYRTWTLQAAVALTPGNCTLFNTTRAAWNAVSVPVQSDEPTCGGGGGTTVFSDTFEANNGWTTNPNATDTATTGAWERGDPEPTSSGSVALQLGTTVSGTNDLVTARLAGASAGTNDVDGGTTSIQSPTIAIPATGTITLSFSWYLAHLNNATSADFFRVSAVVGTTATPLFTQNGSAVNRAGAWGTASVSLNNFRGQTIRIRVEARDDPGTASLIEAGVDNVTITQA